MSISQREGLLDWYLLNSPSMVPLEKEMSVQPNNWSILLSNPRFIEKLGNTDNCLSVDNLHGETGAVPQKAPGEVVLKVCLPWYLDIFGDNLGLSLQITMKYSQGTKSTLEHT